MNAAQLRAIKNRVDAYKAALASAAASATTRTYEPAQNRRIIRLRLDEISARIDRLDQLDENPSLSSDALYDPKTLLRELIHDMNYIAMFCADKSGLMTEADLAKIEVDLQAFKADLAQRQEKSLKLPEVLPEGKSTYFDETSTKLLTSLLGIDPSDLTRTGRGDATAATIANANTLTSLLQQRSIVDICRYFNDNIKEKTIFQQAVVDCITDFLAGSSGYAIYQAKMQSIFAAHPYAEQRSVLTLPLLKQMEKHALEQESKLGFTIGNWWARITLNLRYWWKSSVADTPANREVAKNPELYSVNSAITTLTNTLQSKVREQGVKNVHGALSVNISDKTKEDALSELNQAEQLILWHNRNGMDTTALEDLLRHQIEQFIQLLVGDIKKISGFTKDEYLASRCRTYKDALDFLREGFNKNFSSEFYQSREAAGTAATVGDGANAVSYVVGFATLVQNLFSIGTSPETPQINEAVFEQVKREYFKKIITALGEAKDPVAVLLDQFTKNFSPATSPFGQKQWKELKEALLKEYGASAEAHRGYVDILFGLVVAKSLTYYRETFMSFYWL